MSYKEILVYLDPTPSSDARLRVAADLAKAHGARLIGVDASTDDAFVGEWGQAALEVGSRFHQAIGDAKVDGVFLGDCDRKTASPANELHCVDLIVAPRPGPETRGLIQAFLPDEALINAGVPMLAIPQDWKPGPIGESVVIAWNASREATRAAHDAMPLLKHARKVVIFAFSSGRSGLRASADMLREHLGRHGVTSLVSDWTNTGDLTAVEALFASLDTQDSDLIVAGAYGHSRTFESLFGGVSLDLLKQPTLPMLLSH